MTRDEFLIAVIDDGIHEIQTNYTRRDQLPKRNGAIAGFEICRGKSNVELLCLLEEAKEQMIDLTFPFCFKAGDDAHAQYWYTRYYQMQIEWVLNVLSAGLHGQQQEPLVDFTLRGYLKAANILSRQDA